VKAELALNATTKHLEFEVTSEKGNVAVSGRLPNLNLANEVERVASGVPGVVSVNLNQLVSVTPD
jgi:osmotically-inducible protein OsmY